MIWGARSFLDKLFELSANPSLSDNAFQRKGHLNAAFLR